MRPIQGPLEVAARRCRLRVVSCLVCLALSFSGSAWTQDTGSIRVEDLQTPTAAWLRTALAFGNRTVSRGLGNPATGPGLDPSWVSRNESQGSDFLRRLSSNLDRLGTASQLLYDRVLPNRFSDEAMTPEVEKSVNRATRKTVKGLLLEVTDVAQRLDSIQDRVRGDPLGGEAGGPKGVHVRFGVSHLAPRLEIRYPTATGSMRFSVGALGQVGVDLTRARFSRAQIHGGYDHRTGTYEAGCRLSF